MPEAEVVQNRQFIPTHGAIVRHCLRDPTFSRFDTIRSVTDRHTHTHTHTQRHTHRHTTTAYTALSIASRSKNFQNWLISVEDIASQSRHSSSMTEKTQFPGFMFPQVVERH